MFKVASGMKNIVTVNRFFFSKDLFINGANPIRERVMSTPTWPVPYYQRVVKAYPIRGTPPDIQNNLNPTSEELTFQPATSPGSTPRRSSRKAQRVVKS